MITRSCIFQELVLLLRRTPGLSAVIRGDEGDSGATIVSNPTDTRQEDMKRVLRTQGHGDVIRPSAAAYRDVGLCTQGAGKRMEGEKNKERRLMLCCVTAKFIIV
jgi:hypothetical protein